MLIKFMIATICLPVISMKTGEIMTATQLELMLMDHVMAHDNAVTEKELMTENCYEINIVEK